MGEAKRKALMQNMIGSVTDRKPTDTVSSAPRTVTRGELPPPLTQPHNQSVSNRESIDAGDARLATGGNDVARERLNLSVSPQLRRGLRAAADALGMSESQLALQAIVAGLPLIQQQVKALGDLLPAERKE